MTSNIVSSDNWKLKCILGTGGFGIVELWAHQNGEKLGKLQYNYKYTFQIIHILFCKRLFEEKMYIDMKLIIMILAIKRCKWNYSQLTPVQRKRWANEVDIMSRLRHPNIVKTGCIPFKFPNAEENLPVLCMEYCKKGDLRKVVS